MKKIPNKTALLVTIVLALISLLLYISVYNAKAVITADHSYYSVPENDSVLKSAFLTADIDDSLPHYLYKLQETEFKRKQTHVENQNDGRSKTGWSMGNIGFYQVKKLLPEDTVLTNPYRYDSVNMKPLDSIYRLHFKEKDSLKRAFYQKIQDSLISRIEKRTETATAFLETEKERETDYYFCLSGYSLPNYDTKFFIYNGKNFLAYVKTDTTYKKWSGTVTAGHYEKKEILVRFAKDGTLMIPISKKIFSTAQFLFYPLIFIMLFIYLYFLLGLPVQVLFNISKGDAFSKRNVRNLKWLSSFLILFTTLTLLSPYLFNLIFSSNIPAELKFTSPLTHLKNNLGLVAITVVTMVIRYAFVKGHKLQHYEDLTI